MQIKNTKKANWITPFEIKVCIKTKKQALDGLDLTRYCCRAAFLGQTDTLELINKFKKF